jgi:predicted unusual protein kinase regulating ubiquinone biosynthesis (AarF/ABC1/UbiB family)
MDAWVSHMHASPLGKNIRVPQVYWDLTSERVLTMERVQASASTTQPRSARPASTAPSW